MTSVITVKDKTNRIIVLSQEQWGHITEHHEMTNQTERIVETLEQPDKIITSPEDSSLNYYFKHYKASGRFLLVAAKYLNGTGFIITAFYTTKIGI
ncbi:hypothetical protein HY485_05150 [Candidatus Woesearchaeota archaeon]|nr:hypothetical protein [Candidatus Woesearchaeota archaeon]